MCIAASFKGHKFSLLRISDSLKLLSSVHGCVDIHLIQSKVNCEESTVHYFMYAFQCSIFEGCILTVILSCPIRGESWDRSCVAPPMPASRSNSVAVACCYSITSNSVLCNPSLQIKCWDYLPTEKLLFQQSTSLSTYARTHAHMDILHLYVYSLAFPLMLICIPPSRLKCMGGDQSLKLEIH